MTNVERAINASKLIESSENCFNDHAFQHLPKFRDALHLAVYRLKQISDNSIAVTFAGDTLEEIEKMFEEE